MFNGHRKLKHLTQLAFSAVLLLSFAACSDGDNKQGTKIRPSQEDAGLNSDNSSDSSRQADVSDRLTKLDQQITSGSKATRPEGSGSLSESSAMDQILESGSTGVEANEPGSSIADVDGFDSSQLSLGVVQDSSSSQQTSDGLSPSLGSTYVNGEFHSVNTSDMTKRQMSDLADFLRFKSPDPNASFERADGRSYDPVVTNGVKLNKDTRQYQFDFTAFKKDQAMDTVLKLADRSNSDIEEKFKDENKKFASNISYLKAHIFEYGENVKYSKAHVTMKYYDGEFGEIEKTVELSGIVNRNRQVTLRQEVVIGEPAAPYTFHGYLTCTDNHSSVRGCENNILVIEQMREGTICKRAFAVLNHSEVKITVPDYNYTNESEIRIPGVPYASDSEILNPRERVFASYLNNTVLARRLRNSFVVPSQGDLERLFGTNPQNYTYDHNGEMVPKLPQPYASILTARTFAVAYGISQMELNIRESYYNDTAGRPLPTSALQRPELVDGRRDVLRIVAPLVKDRSGEDRHASAEVDGFIEVPANYWGQTRGWFKPYRDEPLIADSILGAEVVGNDGQGKVDMVFDFGGGDKRLIQIEEVGVDVRDARELTLFPLQNFEMPSDLVDIPAFRDDLYCETTDDNRPTQCRYN